jgi:Mn-containing catalase
MSLSRLKVPGPGWREISVSPSRKTANQLVPSKRAMRGSALATGAMPASSSAAVKGVGNPHHFLAGGQGALPQNSQGRPWTGDYVFSSGDLVEDLTHNFFLETGARNGKLKVYEMVDHPAARALTGYLLVRGGVHQVAYARAVENLTGANLMKLFPAPRIPTEKIPGMPTAHRAR